MKKVLLIMSAFIALTCYNAQAADPVFPDSFDADVSVKGLTMTQGIDQDVYTIKITGETSADKVTITLAVPDGWDGYVAMSGDDFGGGEESLSLRRVTRAEPTEWYPADFLYQMGCVKSDSLTFPVDGDMHWGQMYLLYGENVDGVNFISIETDIQKVEASAPEFPESFTVTSSDENVNIAQMIDQDVYTIKVTGEATADNVTVTVDVPEGWSGIYAITDEDYNHGSDPLRRITRAEDPEWLPLEYMEQMGGKLNNTFTFPADGDDHNAQLFLVWNEMGDVTNMISLEVRIDKAAAEPVFPESFTVTSNDKDVVINQMIDQDVYTIKVTGESASENITVTVDVPEGWDGIMSIMDEDFSHGSDPLRRVVTRAEESEWYPKEAMESMGGKEANTFTIPVDGDDHYAQLYLLWNNMVDGANNISLEVNIEKKAVSDDPVFPKSFDITLSEEGLTLTQGEGPDMYTVTVKGECDNNQVTATFEIPEGWDDYIIIPGEVFGEPELLAARKANRAYPLSWYPAEDLITMGGHKGNSVTLKADGTMHDALLYLLKGEYVDGNNPINLEMTVTGNGMPFFPETFDVTLSEAGLTVSQGLDMGEYTIAISGKAKSDELTVTLAVPEGWDGFLGAAENSGGAQPLATRAGESMWFPIDAALEEGYTKTNSLTFPVDGGYHTGQFYLYKGDQFDAENIIAVVVNVEKDIETPDAVFPETFDVTLSEEGLEMTSDFDMGEYMINISGECEAEEVTITVALPEGWEGFLTKTEAVGGAEETVMAVKALEAMWYPVATLENNGYAKTNKVTFPTDGKDYFAQMHLYIGEVADVNNLIGIEFNVKRSEGVNGIEAENGEARYFNLQGNEVVNPAPGVYVKVVGNKVMKVVIK